MDKPFENGCGHRKKVTIIFAILFVLTVIFVNSCKTPEKNVSRARQTSAYAVIDLRSGKIIKSSNGQAKLPIASTTKILSAITVIEEVFDLDEEIIVPSAAVGIEGSSVYLSPGERISYRDLLYGLMLRSGNDCAVALAIKTSGSVEKFVAKMNEVAKKAGAINSSFANPHGLDDEKHYSTADDLAKITVYAMKNDVFRTIVSTKYHDTSGEVSRCFKNKNKMLWNYDGAIGVKTGYTKKSGRCLVTRLADRHFTHRGLMTKKFDYKGESLMNKPIVIEEKDPMLCGEAICKLQAAFNALGYTDANGKPLAEDGKCGKKTLQALKSFIDAHSVKPIASFCSADGACTLEVVKKNGNR